MVDPISVLKTAASLVQFIASWKSDYDDASGALKQIRVTVGVVRDVVAALDPERHVSLATPLQTLVDCLNETKDILIANQNKVINKMKMFAFPASVNKKISDLEERILKLVNIMSLAVSATHLVQSDKNQAAPAKPSTALDFLNTDATKDFWKANFGETVFAIKWEELEKAVTKQFPDYVNADMLIDLHFRLDNLKTGFISCHRLSEFCGGETIKQRLEEYKERIKTTDTVPPSPQPDHGEIRLPHLLWIDDRPQNNTSEVEYAEKKKIHITKVTTTAEAKQWIINHPTAMEIEEPNKFHIITDNARQDADTILNINAGEDIIRFVRGRRSHVPIFVYCGDLKYTAYTANYTGCRAGNKRSECLAFIDELQL